MRFNLKCKTADLKFPMFLGLDLGTTNVKALVTDHEGRPLATKVFKPQEIYRECRNVAPDLMVYFGDLDWRAVGTVGMGGLYTFENDTGPDGANHAQQGIFVMKGPGVPGGGKLEGLELVDCGPTVLRALGLPAPAEMIGRAIG